MDRAAIFRDVWREQQYKSARVSHLTGSEAVIATQNGQVASKTQNGQVQKVLEPCSGPAGF